MNTAKSYSVCGYLACCTQAEIHSVFLGNHLRVSHNKSPPIITRLQFYYHTKVVLQIDVSPSRYQQFHNCQSVVPASNVQRCLLF